LVRPSVGPHIASPKETLRLVGVSLLFPYINLLFASVRAEEEPREEAPFVSSPEIKTSTEIWVERHASSAVQNVADPPEITMAARKTNDQNDLVRIGIPAEGVTEWGEQFAANSPSRD
jgi:cytoskeletal protein RodZ